MKMTLLEIVSDILNDMDGDYVNSINDTDESLQVAQIVKSTYMAMISNRNWPHTARTIELVPFTDNTKPTHMKINEPIKELISVYYNVQRLNDTRLDYKQIKYIDPDAFLRHANQRNSNDPNTLVVTDPSGIKLLITSNTGPSYFTSFNDTDLVFDSYDRFMESTLQASNVQARAYIMPSFEMSDYFVPDLPVEAFTALLEEAKSRAQLKLRSVQDIKAEQEAGRQNRWLSRKGWTAHEADIYPYDYGRRRGGGLRKDPTFRRP